MSKLNNEDINDSTMNFVMAFLAESYNIINRMAPPVLVVEDMMPFRLQFAAAHLTSFIISFPSDFLSVEMERASFLHRVTSLTFSIIVAEI